MNSNTSNLPAVFNLNYNGFTIRHVKDNDGKIWFVAKDIAQKLGYSEESIATPGKLFGNVPEVWKGRKPIPVRSENGVEQIREMLCVTENGAYFFLARSDKPGALDFQMWLAGEVVPSIMHTGEYVHPAVKQAREEKPKPVAIPRDIKIYLSKANFSAQEKIINRAVDAFYLIKKNGMNDETDKECLKVIALDIAFKKRTGYSALEAAGISIEQNTKGNIAEEDNWLRIDWFTHYNVAFNDERLILPEPTFEEHFTDE